MRVLIVDDHAIVRKGLEQILADAHKDVVIGEATNAEDAIQLVDQGEWDVVILDISMPGRSGLDALKEMKRIKPAVPVLVLSIHPEEQYATRVLRAGASGYMTKQTAPEELLTAIDKVTAGGKYVSALLAERLASDLETEAGEFPPHKRLSDREYEVLLLIASGHTITEIADKLTLSVKTISTYRARILEKTGLTSNAALVQYAMTYGLVDWPPEKGRR
ncbi:MAG: response regulator receiver, LuxR family [Candidatus Krumholzibacteriota bacterium]|nr:response regulator receiver, LuxR family [Candidatus Krumholzibacteriota bacterium]